jgi:hypothetical protein
VRCVAPFPAEIAVPTFAPTHLRVLRIFIIHLFIASRTCGVVACRSHPIRDGKLDAQQSEQAQQAAAIAADFEAHDQAPVSGGQDKASDTKSEEEARFLAEALASRA